MIKIAEKTYKCDACKFLYDLDENDFEGVDKRIFNRLIRTGLIKPGEKYLEKESLYEGKIYVFRAKMLAHKFFLKHDIYDQVGEI